VITDQTFKLLQDVRVGEIRKHDLVFWSGHLHRVTARHDFSTGVTAHLDLIRIDDVGVQHVTLPLPYKFGFVFRVVE
jgi:hypothetical protein